MDVGKANKKVNFFMLPLRLPLIMTTLFYKIPPHLPLPKGGKLPLFGLQPIGPLARRAKRGQERSCCVCQFNFETLDDY
jgi:hypothetical protein